MNYIYGLYCPISGGIRYIGKAKNTEARFRSHMRAAKKESKSHVARWIGTLIRAGLVPELRILRELNPGHDWRVVERECIEKARVEGVRLTNILAGGQGAMYLDTASPEYVLRNAAVSVGVKASWQKPERRVRHNAAWQNPKLRARHSAKMTEVQTNPAVKAKQSAANSANMRRLKNDPKAYDDWRRACSIGLKAAWERTREALRNDPEALRQFHDAHTLAGKKSLETAKSRGTDSTSPAVRERISNGVKAARQRKKWSTKRRCEQPALSGHEQQ